MTISCYERLGVEETADAQQIKRAYYTQVKKQPPERFPEEYKTLRAAYDILSDAKKRAEYDRIRVLPEDVIFLFGQACKQGELGQRAQADVIYQQILRRHPKLEPVKVALAQSYEAQGKSGKAASLWEDICAQAPENPEYAFKLALSYESRGWNKKAAAQYRHTLELDSGNADCWVFLLRSRLTSNDEEELLNICERGIQALGEHGKSNVLLYSFAAIFSALDDMDAAERYLSEAVHVTRSGGGRIEDSNQAVYLLLEAAASTHMMNFLRYIQEMAAALPNLDDDIQEKLAETELAAEIEDLQEHGFSVLFHDLFGTLFNGCDCQECRFDLMAIECNLLSDVDAYRSQILRLRKEHPRLYALHAGFFSELLSARDTQKMLRQRVKILDKHGLSPAMLENEDGESDPEPAEPIRRIGPKVGRNDPCPCGSGKKFKKCCGREA
ncbi:MAG: DnaJ domain-containing protein [Peptococcaceae bacterium]|jgi:curved DNA-binding protein CbpA|nr:DnaJ domain-containing protein [Peptococcaceae bacterium]